MYRAGERRSRNRTDVDCDLENAISQSTSASTKKSKFSRLHFRFVSFAAVMLLLLFVFWMMPQEETQIADGPLEVDLDPMMNVDEPPRLSILSRHLSKLSLSRRFSNQKTARPGEELNADNASTETRESQLSENEANRTVIHDIIANDLWAIHDMLLVGYGAVFMIPQSGGYWDVQDSSVEFASILKDLHPFEACRTMIGLELKKDYDKKTKVIAVANATWSCLPANFNRTFFEQPFVPEYLDENRAGIYAGRFPTVRKPYMDLLGSCSDSPWPRTCSYWTALHLMAYRADALMLSNRFLRIMTSLIAGGITMCGGCTLHFRVLLARLLSKNLEEDLGRTF